MSPKEPTRLPVRYYSSARKGDAFRMSDIFRPDHRIQVLGVEPGKSKGKDGKPALNIVLQHPSAPSDKIILTPKDFFSKLRVEEPLACPCEEPEAKTAPKPVPVQRKAWVTL